MVAAARSVDIELDGEKCRVAPDPRTGGFAVVATCAFPAESQRATDLKGSALHATLLDEFRDVRQSVDIKVHVPPAPHVPPRPVAPAPVRVGTFASEWISEQVTVHDEFVSSYALQLLLSSLSRILEAYPWRDRVAMKIRMAQSLTLLNQAMPQHLHRIVRIAIDNTLPSMTGILNDADCATVTREASLHLQKDVVTALDVYEAVHDMVVTRGRCDVSHEVAILYDNLFAY